jgi:hypothetical protein
MMMTTLSKDGLAKKQYMGFTGMTKAEQLEENPGYFEIYLAAVTAGLSGRHAVIAAYKQDTGLNLAVGSVYNWLGEYHPEVITRNVTAYGAGTNVKTGRSNKCTFTNADGEVYVRTNAGWRPQYHAMMAGPLSPLKEYDVVIHHINGDHTDNSPANLELMSRADHSSLHSLQMWDKRKGRNQ